MNNLFAINWIAIATVSFSGLAAAGQIDKEFQKLQEARDEAAAKAVLPIDRKFKEALKDLLAKSTAAGELETALLIKRKIQSLDDAVNGFSLDGTRWTRGNGDTVFTLKAGGKFEEQWGDITYKGTWDRISTSEIKMIRKDNSKTDIFTIGKNSDTITRNGDGAVWDLEKDQERKP